MVDSGLDVLIAFSGGKGTADMVARALKAGVLVLEVKEDTK
jgi:predicted polyphosphate/ATP-dependent NAD kinase